MNRTGAKIQSFLKLVRKHWFILFAIATYIIFTASYMGPGFTDCKNSIYGFGDSTAGPIWRNSLKPDQPILGGYEKSTNFPDGESLYSPVSYASFVQSITMKSMSKAVGPVCAYNLYNIVGYLTTSLLMFFFVSYMLRNRWIALLAGYAVAFTPYIQSKVGGHPSYGYGSLLIAALWLSIHLLRYGKKSSAVMLSFVLAICAYFDPYFILLAITMLVPVFIVTGYEKIIQLQKLKSKERKHELTKFLKPVFIMLIVFSVLVAPLIFIRIKDSKLIESSVGNVRGNVAEAAMLCSNKPLDYLLPDPTNIHLVDLYGQDYTSKNIELRNWCGFGESRVSISLTIIAVVILTMALWCVKRARGKLSGLKNITSYQSKTIIIIIGAIAMLAFLLGLPPYIHDIITPSGIVLKITSMWRIFAREYIVLNIALVLMFAISLKYASHFSLFKKNIWLKVVLYCLLFLGIIAEYQINAPFGPMAFNYKNDVPSVYAHVKNNPDIKTIAEYPIDRMGLEYDSTVYYLTMQAVHGKSLVNSAAIKDPNELIHVALKDLTDPQTIPALRYIGVRYVVIHGENPDRLLEKIPGLTIIETDIPPVYALTMVRSDEDSHVVLAKLPEVKSSPNLLVIKKGYVVNLPLIHSPIGIEYEVLQDTELQTKDLTHVYDRNIQVCFDVKMSAQGDESLLIIRKGKVEVSRVKLTDKYTRVSFDSGAGETIQLHNSKGYNMRLNNLGCQ
ncbi:MAG: hypothetical protein ABIR46_04160 [Candidatus Saccharimonadales bacterium]